MRTKIILLFFGLFFISSQVFSQRVRFERLPEYVVITTENSSLLGGVGVSIDWRKSDYRDQLELLQKGYLKDAKNVKTLSDLLTAMSELGYDYHSSFEARSGDLSNTRSNLVFRKKAELVKALAEAREKAKAKKN